MGENGVVSGFHGLSSAELEDFHGVLPQLIEELRFAPGLGQVDEKLHARLERLIRYNAVTRNQFRSTTIILAYKTFVAAAKPADPLTADKLKLVYIAAWCFQIRQGGILIADDIVDKSRTRRRKPCWYLLEDEAEKAPMDSLLLEAAAAHLLTKHFCREPYFPDLMTLFHHFLLQTGHGKMLEVETRGFGKINTFSTELYDAIAEYKTCYYSFEAPLLLAMIMAGTTTRDPELVNQIKSLAKSFGHLYQVRDDYIDWTSNESVSGSPGTDIANGRCTWVATTAWKVANDRQREILEENYGLRDAARVQVIKELYRELGIPQIFHKYAEEADRRILDQIQQLPRYVAKDAFLTIARQISSLK